MTTVFFGSSNGIIHYSYLVAPKQQYFMSRTILAVPYLTLPSGWAGRYTCPALRPYQFGPMRSPDVTRRSQ